MSKTERQAEVEHLEEQIRSSATVFVTDFSGLNVLKMTDFRRRLRASGARYIVVKNTLAQRAFARHQITALDEHLTGQTGLVFAGEDPLAAAKALGDFVREHDNKPAVKAGWVDGKAVAPAYVKRLGEIPSREVLLGQFAGALNGVLYQVVGALQALHDKRTADQASS